MGENQFYIPKRYIFTALSSVGLLSISALRVSLSIAIIAMTNNTISMSGNNTYSVPECPNLLSQKQNSGTEEQIVSQYNWNAHQQGLILGAFYYGYTATQFPGGFLSEKIGAKWLFGGAVLNTAVFSLLTPLVVSWGAVPLIIVRVIEGLGEGVMFPAINLMISRWAPILERSRMSTIIFNGSQIGIMLGMAFSGWLSSTDFLGGWPSAFYLFGSVGCIWFLFWFLLVYESPAKHPKIAFEELQLFQKDEDESSQKNVKTPWKCIFTSLPMWAVLVAHVGNDFGFFFFLSELPTYLDNILHFSIKENGVLSALPFLVQAIGALVSSFIADHLRKSNLLSITNIRKMFNTIAFIVPAICMLGITVSGCRQLLNVCLITLAMAANGFMCSGYNVTHVDMSPTFAGTMYGITNTAACVGGFIAPAVVGIFTQDGATLAGWNNVFYVTAFIYIVTAAFFSLFASAELQSWGNGKDSTKLCK